MANPYSSGGNATTGGGNGNWSTSTDTINSFSLPTIRYNSAFTNTYEVAYATLKSLSDYFWNPLTSFERYFTKADDAILSCYLLPIPESALGTLSTYNITVGNKETGYTGKLLSGGITLDCGSITVSEYSGSFLDYNQYTQISLYLPYMGTVSLDANIVMGRTINVKYNIDLYSGNLTAMVYVDGSLSYQYDGNCAYIIATTSLNFAEMITNTVATAARIIMALM